MLRLSDELNIANADRPKDVPKGDEEVRPDRAEFLPSLPRDEDLQPLGLGAGGVCPNGIIICPPLPRAATETFAPDPYIYISNQIEKEEE